MNSFLSTMKTKSLLITFYHSLLLALLTVSVSAAPEAEQADRKADLYTVQQGQRFIDEGRYRDAIREFTCVIEAQPTEVEGYRGRMEAELLLGQYSEAFREYARIVAFVLPVQPDAESTMLASYANRLASAPGDVPALTGASFTRWCLFDYPGTIHVINRLLELRPNDVYGNLFRGSSRVLQGASRADGAMDLERAIALAPRSPDVRYIVADAYTYGSEPDLGRAFAEATRALEWGLDTPRIHAIIAAGYNASGDLLAAATHINRHIELVTTELLPKAPLAPGTRSRWTWWRGGLMRSPSRRLLETRSRSRPAAKITGTPSSCCSLPTVRQSSAVTTPMPISPHSIGLPRKRGRTGCGLPSSRALTPASFW